MGKKTERNTTWMYMLSMHAWLKYDLEVEHFFIFFFMFHLYFVILLVDTSILQTGTVMRDDQYWIICL